MSDDSISIEYAGNVIVMSARMWHDAVLGQTSAHRERDEMRPLVEWCKKISASHAQTGSAIIHGCQCGLCKLVRAFLEAKHVAPGC